MKQNKKINNGIIYQFTYCSCNYGSALQCYASQDFYSRRGNNIILVKRKYTFLERVYRSMTRRIRLSIQTMIYPEIRNVINLQNTGNKKSLISISDSSKEAISKFSAERIKSVHMNSVRLITSCYSNSCVYCIAGSDQIWNANRIDNDITYFLPFAPSNKRIAFAPSFGSSVIPAFNTKRFAKYISRFNKLSVRELSGCKLIDELTGRIATLLLDPVFLLERKEWEAFAEKSVFSRNEKYVFCFFLDEPSPKAIKSINEYKKSGLAIVTLGYEHQVLKNLDSVYYDGSPYEFVSMINCADYVVTDSFHATAFSLIFQKPFMVFERNYKGNNQAVRITDILSSLDLSYRYDSNITFFTKLTLAEKNNITNMIIRNKENVNGYLNDI